MICTCKSCRYSFEAHKLPDQCPDCGKYTVREATPDEITIYYDFRREFGYPEKITSSIIKGQADE